VLGQTNSLQFALEKRVFGTPEHTGTTEEHIVPSSQSVNFGLQFSAYRLLTKAREMILASDARRQAGCFERALY
jgi:hypothetical protein